MTRGDRPVDKRDSLTNALIHIDAAEERLRAENEHLVEAQRNWEEALEQYSELFMALPVPALTIDASGLVRKMNQAAIELLGKELVGHSLRHRVEMADRRRLIDLVTESRKADDQAISCDLKVLTREGRTVPMQVSARRLKAPGSPAVVTLIDVAARDEAIAQQQHLLQNEKEAKAATQARDHFIAMLSHELRTPLTPVMAAVSAALRADHGPPNMKKTFAMIARNIEAERRLIDDLLDTTRIAHGKLRVDRAPIDLHGVVEEAIDLLESDLKRKNLAVLVDLAADQCWVYADGGRLRQVFWNLLQNAVKFSAEGSHITVCSWNRDKDLMVEVTDTGVGMEPEAMNRLFTPFHQVRPSADADMPSRAGLGLGLAISRGIVELHEGHIHATSPGLGRGSRFIVELPTIAPPAAATCATPGPASLTPTPEPMTAPQRRILLVEDDPDTAETLADLLRSEGFNIFVATSVNAALERDVAEVDLVLSDIGLTDGSGLDLMRQIRTKKNVPGIALSGYASEADIQASQEAGFSAHLVKPVSLEKLVATIRRTRRDGRVSVSG
jgi:PAS domain S-box-containing protein